MDSALKIWSTNIVISHPSPSPKSHFNKITWFGFTRSQSTFRIYAASDNGSVSQRGVRNAVGDVHKQRSSLESLFCYDKAIPEEIIEKPIGLSINEKEIGNNPRCLDCHAKGAVICATCSGSGLYVDSILESQGIIVKVRCLGCGGTGNIMCSHCGGRGHCHVG